MGIYQHSKHSQSNRLRGMKYRYGHGTTDDGKPKHHKKGQSIKWNAR